jgi:hypothetical protein
LKKKNAKKEKKKKKKKENPTSIKVNKVLNEKDPPKASSMNGEDEKESLDARECFGG